MKKFLLTMLLCISACCCLLFGGCSAKGTYTFKELKYSQGNTELSVRVGDKYEGIELREDFITLVLEEDGQFILRVHTEIEEDGETESNTQVTIGKWVDGIEDEIYLTIEGEEAIVLKKDGKKLAGEILAMGLSIVLEK